MTIDQIKKELQLRLKALGFERDRLRELESVLSQQADEADEALENLESAIDSLSRSV